MKVRLWLTVSEGGIYKGPQALWTKEIETGLPPSPGEEIVLWAYEANPADGPKWPVKSRH